MTDSLKKMISKQSLAEIDKWIDKYPPDEKQSAVMQALMIVQEELGFLNQERMDAVGAYLDMPAIAVYEVATFYSMYEHAPIGKHRIDVCTNISCKLRGSSDVVKHIEEVLAVKVGDTTEDKKFTLRTVECLGACAGAPMFQIDKTYYENLTPEKIDKIIDDYKYNRIAKLQSRDKKDD